MNRGYFIGIDWGSTNARAMLFDPAGRVLEQEEYPLGIKQVAPGAHRECFDRMTSAWRTRHASIPVFLSGMIGSRHGWHEVPYLACPTALAGLSKALFSVPDEERVFIVPGLKMNQDRPDVLRGEELQILGLGETGSTFQLVCIPGTHAKWIATDGKIMREFHTAMTGEIFAAITDHTLFSQLIPPAARLAPLRDAAFDSGLERSAGAHRLLHDFFELRAGLLLGRIAADDLPDLISGLLIGTEIRHMQSLVPAGTRVAVLGATGVGERYQRALHAFSFETVAFDVREITARGFVALHRGLLEARK